GHTVGWVAPNPFPSSFCLTAGRSRTNLSSGPSRCTNGCAAGSRTWDRPRRPRTPFDKLLKDSWPTVQVRATRFLGRGAEQFPATVLQIDAGVGPDRREVDLDLGRL